MVSGPRPYARWGIRVCPHCGEQFKPCHRNQQWCGVQCAGAARRGPNSPFWKGGTLRSDGYLTIGIGGRRKLFHRYVMEDLLGRELTPEETVHHLDGNPLNNDPSNLEVLPSKGSHRIVHTKTFRSETHKECPHCHVIKPRSEFGPRPPSRGNGDPNDLYCNPCKPIVQAERRARLRKSDPYGLLAAERERANAARRKQAKASLAQGLTAHGKPRKPVHRRMDSSQPRTCRVCGETKPGDQLTPRRNLCQECQKRQQHEYDILKWQRHKANR